MNQAYWFYYLQRVGNRAGILRQSTEGEIDLGVGVGVGRRGERSCEICLKPADRLGRQNLESRFSLGP